MERYLIPRITLAQAKRRLQEIEEQLSAGIKSHSLIQFNPPEAIPNATGGQAATAEQLISWREKVTERVAGKSDPSTFDATLGQALTEEINFIPSDAAHDGVWHFLSLHIFPDVVFRRWPGKSGDLISGGINLPEHRWIGAPEGRDRNYLKTSWRRWNTLGAVLKQGEPPLGEDELVGLLERSAMARNPRLLVASAKKILSMKNFPRGRSPFARELQKILQYHTGARSLDYLSDRELAALVDQATDQVVRAMHQSPPPRRPVPPQRGPH